MAPSSITTVSCGPNVNSRLSWLMLTSFGIFWTGEGLGAEWPGEDLFLLAIFALTGLVSFGLVQWLRNAPAPAAGAAS